MCVCHGNRAQFEDLFVGPFAEAKKFCEDKEGYIRQVKMAYQMNKGVMHRRLDNEIAFCAMHKYSEQSEQVETFRPIRTRGEKMRAAHGDTRRAFELCRVLWLPRNQAC